jgi:mannosyltransferase
VAFLNKMSPAEPSPSTSSPLPEPPRSAPPARINVLPAALVALLLLAFALRIFLLDGQSIWWDEGISLHLSTSDLIAIFSDRLNNIHPPLYFILLKGWLALTGVTVFSARYLSVLAGWLMVPVVYAISVRWFNRRMGLVAAFLATISAVSVIYAQEIRVYALLPLAYLALLAITRELTRREKPQSRDKWPLWAALGLVSWIALHLHYVSLFAVGYVTIWAALSFIFARRRRELMSLVFVQFLVILASLPWFLAAAANWRGIAGEANAGTFVTEAVSFRFLLAQVWTFHLTGLAGSLARPGVELVAGISALLLLGILFLRFADHRTRREVAFLLANWLIPLSSALLVWLVRSFSHPRYVAMYAPGLILLAAYLIIPDRASVKSGIFSVSARAAALLLLVFLTALSIWGLALYYFDEEVAKDDIRGVARYLEEAAGAEDLILVPDTDWSLPFVYQGDARVAMPGLESREDYWQNLAGLTAASPRVFVLDYERGTRDWQNVLPFALQSSGTLSEEVKMGNLLLRVYDLDRPLSAPEFEPQREQFGPLALTGISIEQEAEAETALAVALRWRAGGDAPLPPASVALRLLDDNSQGVGRVISTVDDRLLDHNGRPSDQWAPSQIVSTYHLLPLPQGLPPLTYTLAVEAYEDNAGQVRPLDLLDEQGAPKGQVYLVQGVQTARGRPVSTGEAISLPGSQLAEAVVFDPGLNLEDVAFSPQELTPGNILQVQLLWQANSNLPDLRPGLALVQNGRALAFDDSAPSAGRYPTSMWEVGEKVLEMRELLIPVGSSGEAELILQLGDQTLSLGDISIKAREHTFIEPIMDQGLDVRFGDIARLAGYNLEERVYSTAETVPLTLLWQPLRDGSAGDYVVFTHILGADGRLIGQHDGVPDQGRRPISGWVKEENILDHHEITFRDRAYEGTAVIEVGLYDPLTGERIMLPDGSDHILLPVELRIENAG